ncbi:MAG: hypothetical protein VX724_01835, partial [Chloroflexota bacterium]|nr:hypothetical protein [Chloroflexota bacterium]
MNTEVRLSFSRKINFADGHSFGDVGPYERWLGTASFALDPNDSANTHIVDLEYAPQNAKGLVEFTADLEIMKPVDLSKGNHRILYDVNNRGNKTALSSFNDAPRNHDPLSLADAGNGYLMRKGYTVVISGWQGDLMPDPALVIAELPEAIKDGKPIPGTIRQEFIANDPGVLSMPLSGHRVIRSYEPTDPDNATLTVRELEHEERQHVNKDEWSFSTVSADLTGSLKIVPSSTHLYIKNGFKPGHIYELIYNTQGSRVMELGMVGIRDLLS